MNQREPRNDLPLPSEDTGDLARTPPDPDDEFAAHVYGSIRFVLDVWAGYFGRPTRWHFDARLPYLEVSLLDTGAILDPIGQLRQVYPNVLHVERQVIRCVMACFEDRQCVTVKVASANG